MNILPLRLRTTLFQSQKPICSIGPRQNFSNVSPTHRGYAAGTMKRRTGPERPISPPPRKKILSSTTSEAVSSFFTPKSAKKLGETSWKEEGTLICLHHKPNEDYIQAEHQRKRRRIAAFDLDSTLIKATSGRFSKNATDWMWIDPTVIPKLRDLDSKGYQVVVFSNQGGLRGDEKAAKALERRKADFKAKLGSIVNELNIPISAFAATGQDKYRKPRVGMWEAMKKYYGLEGDDSVDMETSFFVGDAGGRYKDGEHSDADFSSSDRDFAANIGIKYSTPEEFFQGHTTRKFKRAFDPHEYLQEDSQAGSIISPYESMEIVLFCGSPGAGKSTFYWTHFAPLGYERVNQDILKTRDRCLAKAMSFLLEDCKSVVVDNTNADPPTRKHWIDLARNLSIPIRCILFTATPRLCEHNDAVRALNGSLMNPEGRTLLPKMAFAGFGSRFKEPLLEEGFREIIKVQFQFKGTDEQRKAWARFYI